MPATWITTLTRIAFTSLRLQLIGCNLPALLVNLILVNTNVPPSMQMLNTHIPARSHLKMRNLLPVLRTSYIVPNTDCAILLAAINADPRSKRVQGTSGARPTMCTELEYSQCEKPWTAAGCT